MNYTLEDFQQFCDDHADKCDEENGCPMFNLCPYINDLSPFQMDIEEMEKVLAEDMKRRIEEIEKRKRY